MEWSNQGFKWTALLCLLLLNEQASAFSACQHPPQEIQISRGQKITVVYWVGQNTIEDEGLQEEVSALPSTEIQEISTTESSDLLQNATSGLEENNSTPDNESLLSSTSVADHSTTGMSTENESDATTVIDDERIATESQLQVTDDKHDITKDSSHISSSEAPKIPSTTFNDSTLQDTLSTTESDSADFLISGRNDSADIEENQNLTTGKLPGSLSTTSTVPLVSQMADVTAAQSEAIDVHQLVSSSTESQNEETRTVSSRQLISDNDDGTEVEYWSTTIDPQKDYEENTTYALSDDQEVTDNLKSTTFSETDGSELVTSQMSAELTGKSIAETTTGSSEINTVTINDREVPNSDNQPITNDDNSNISENVTELLDGKSLETVTIFEGQQTELVDETTEETVTATLETMDNDTMVVNASGSDSGLQFEVRASLLAEGTLNPLEPRTENSTENAMMNPTITDRVSLLESISTTLSNLFSTSAPLSTEFEVTSATAPKNRALHEGGLQQSPEKTLNTNHEQQGVNETSVASEIIFPNTTADPEITIDPRDPGNDEANVTEDERSDSINHNSTITNITDISEMVTTELYDTATNAELQTVQVVSSTPKQLATTADHLGTTEDEKEEAETEKVENESDAQPNASPEAIDPFLDMPDLLVPIDNQPSLSTEETAEEFDPALDNITEEGRRIGSSNDQLDLLASTDPNGPILIPISEDDISSNNEDELSETSKLEKDRPQAIFLSPPTDDATKQDELAPPPIFLRYPHRGDNSFSNRHELRIHNSPQVYIDDLQPAASSSSGLIYRNLYSSDQAMMPVESPVHYVSVLRAPDGVLPIHSLRTTSSKRKRVLQPRMKRNVNETNCEWVFKSAPGVPLLLTFKSFSTPETTDCEDHYISVERESNGFQSRWCGVSKDRAGHASFARSEIRLRLFSKGDGSFPTGFSVEVQALDLKLLRKYAEVRRIIKQH